MLLIDEKLYLNFVEKYGEEKAEKLDEVVCELCSFPTEKVQRILGVDYDEVMNIYSQIQDTRDKQVLKMLRQIAKNAGLDGSVILNTILRSKKPNCGFDAYKNEYVDMVVDNKYRGVTLKKAWTIDARGLSAMISSFTATIIATFSGFDVLHFHAEGPCAAMWIPKIFGKRCVATVHGLDWQREKWGKGFASRYIKFGERVMVKCADEIIVLSKSAQDYFKETYNRETVLIHNGIDRPIKKEADEITKKYGLSKGEYICIVSRLTAEKGIHYLVDAYNQITTDKKLVIAGDTSDTDDYVEMLKQKASDNPNIIITGPVDDVREYLTKGSIFITPMISGTGIKNKILEAMSMELPVVSTSIGISGINSDNYIHYLLADTPEEFKNRMLQQVDYYKISRTT